MNVRDEIRVLGGVVYMLQSIGPRTEPCGMPHERGHGGDANRRQKQRKSEMLSKF